MPLPVWLPTWLTNLLGAGWLRGLLGIRKDLVDTKKAKLEVRKLQAEERKRESLITLATFEDVKKYDPNTRKLLDELDDGHRDTEPCLSVDDEGEELDSFTLRLWRQHRLVIIAIIVHVLLFIGVLLFPPFW